jgi:hypothetical protein
LIGGNERKGMGEVIKTSIDWLERIGIKEQEEREFMC